MFFSTSGFPTGIENIVCVCGVERGGALQNLMGVGA